MSASQDNKAFITGVLSNAGIDFSKSTFGIWTSSFQHVNYGDPTVNSGYSYARPLIEDLVSAGFPITGQTFNFVSLDGKSPTIKFLLTSGVKGVNGYESLEPLAELSSSYFSGLKPVVVLPDMDFAGKLYRRYEATGLVKSSITRNNILAVSGEDWQELSNTISANNTDQEYSYEDSAYSGYSNQSCTRYKFLYNDSGNSIPQDFYEFEFPLQLESSSIIKYRISRRSDPVGTYQVPYFTADGKVIIDYSQYKEEISGALEGSTNYDFNPIKIVSCTKDEAKTIFDNNISIIKSLTGQNNTNESVTGVKFYKALINNVNYLLFDLLATGEYSGIYKASVTVDRFLLNKKENIEAYVMTGFNVGDGNNIVINLGVNSGVYPRIIEDGQPYNYNDLASIVDIEDVIGSEMALQDLSVGQEDTATDDNESSVLADTLAENFAAFSNALNDEFADNPSKVAEDPLTTRIAQDNLDTAVSISGNFLTPIQKSLVPNFPLPKKTYTRDYFSNYLNSGESYVLTPLAEYSLNSAFASYGNEYGRLGYYLDEDANRNIFRYVVNSTARGIYIDQQGFCDGLTAVYAPPDRYSDGSVYVENGLTTEIDSRSGVIKQSTYFNEDSWKNSINYFYAKNYVASFDIYPSFDQNDYDGLFNQVFTQVKQRIPGPRSDNQGQDSFYLNQGVNGPRIFVEREIYTEDYQSNQIEELNKSIAGTTIVVTGASQANAIQEKLYCVQSYDASVFTNNIQSFYPSQAYRELFSFDEFIPNSDFVPATYEGSKVTSYYTGENSIVGDLYFEDKNYDSKRVFRSEYVTGLASTFNYSNYSNAAVWNGSNGGTISFSSPNLERYSYHLFEYTASSTMKLVKSNVKNGDIASITELNATVLKFQKNSIAGKALTFAPENITYNYLKASVQDSSLAIVDKDKVKFNIQAYKYDLTYAIQDLDWVTFSENPVNNNTYGVRGSDREQNSVPRFFQDDLQETKNIALETIQFPNGPYTSKNYEGTPVKEQNLNALKNGLFDNLIKVREAGGTEFQYESNCTLDVVSNGVIKKGFAPDDARQTNNWITLSNTRRLRITRVRYNFYIKDLILIGDAGFSYSSQFNNGWEYKLQYKKSGETNWKTMGESSSFSSDNFSSVNVTPSPYFYRLPDFSVPSYLAMVAFRTNIPWFLDDASFEFRVAKYEKLSLFSDTVSVIKKTNFLPIGVDWTQNSQCQYYNIYQKDFYGNLKLIRTINEKTGSALALPDISQRLVNLGVSGFAGVNGTGYYDVVVSGIIPSVNQSSQSVDSGYGFSVGDSDDPLTQRVLQNNSVSSTAVAISGPTYSGIIDFNNPEYRTENFVLDPRYDGFYFVSSGASATSSNISNRSYEAYVANSGVSTISVAGSGVSAGQVAKITDNGVVSVSSFASVPAPTLDLEDFSENESLIITSSVNITNTTAISQRRIFVINNSSSSVNVQLDGGSAYALAGNKTALLVFTSPSSVSPEGSLMDNYEIQNEKIYRPANSFVNVDMASAELGTGVFSSLGVFNKFENSLTLKNIAGSSVGSVAADSFSLVSWNGTSATVSQKDYFDDIKVYLRGSEPDDSCIIIIKDDTEIILSNFQSSAAIAKKSYYFLKDEESNRDFTIKITNGSSTVSVPKRNQDFRLTVEKNINGSISYSILYPTSDPIFEISDEKEQLVLVTQAGWINPTSLESKMSADSFIYFINKSDSFLNFSKDSTKVDTQFAPNQIAKAYLVDSKLKISAIGSLGGLVTEGQTPNNGVFSKLVFNVSPTVHMADTLNILDLEFCGTEIKLPTVSNFVGKELFLLSRNRTVPNVINPNSISNINSIIKDSDDPGTQEINDIGQIKNDSIALRIYKKESTDLKPTIERIPFIETTDRAMDGKQIKNDTEIISDTERYFYIDDEDLNSFVLRDYYNRRVSYKGKIFLPSTKAFNVKSLDRNTSYSSSPKQVLEFDYIPDKYANGRFTIDESKTVKLYNNSSEGYSTVVTTGVGDIVTDEIAINFAYENVLVNGNRLNKNRLFKKDYRSGEKFGIYNDKEFFLPRQRLSTDLISDNTSLETGCYDYQILPDEEAIDTIVIPDTMVANTGFVIKNLSSRTVIVQKMSFNGAAAVSSSNYQYSLLPNEQKKFIYNSGWTGSTSTVALSENTISITKTSQQSNIDPNHPFYVFYKNIEIRFDLFWEQFVPDSSNALTLDVNNGTSTVSYQIVDANSGTIPSASASSLRIVCFGRTTPDANYGGINFVVNNFYVFVKATYTPYYSNAPELVVIRRGKFFDASDDQTKNLEIISRKNVDLGKFFTLANITPEAPNPAKIPNNWVIPIPDNLTTFCLPNLAQIGSSALDRQIIFINMAQSPPSAPNKIYDYNTNTYESLSDLNAFTVYKVVSSGGSYIWSKQTTGLPSIQTAYAKLNGLKGLTRTSTNDISIGKEFVYLPNIKRFDLDINSFENKEYGDILLFNSAHNNLEINSDSSGIGSKPFVKIKINVTSGLFSATDIGVNESSSFSVVKPGSKTQNLNADSINFLYRSLKQGTFIKYVNIENGQPKSYYFTYDSNKIAVEATVSNKDFAVLDLKNLTQYNASKKLFIYGSAFVSDSGGGFYSYKLKLTNVKDLGSEKFYIYNNTAYQLFVHFTDNNFIIVPSKMMLEVSSNLALFSEIHEKSAFYVSRSKANFNYINKIGINFRFDSLPRYENLDSTVSEVQETDTLNCATTCLTPDQDYVGFIYPSSSTTSYYQGYFTNANFYYFPKKSLANIPSFAMDQQTPTERLVKKPFVKITSTSAAHYIFSSPSVFIKAQNPSSGSSFYVNNTSEDMLLLQGSTSRKLYRNTVMVISSDGSIRYLKKAKKRDEFYCLFCPRTAISTQREITLQAGIPRSYDVLPILDGENSPQQSYVKILSKNGQSSYVYLSLRDYYNGRDVPTSVPENALAYEVGIGHETIYKVLFYNPQDSTYTMPGIVNGFKYLVEIDDSLYRDLKTLPGVNGEAEVGLFEPIVKYKGVEYKNGSYFIGSDNPNYEVRYPNYVRIYKVVEEIGKQYPRDGADTKPSATDIEGTNATEIVAQETKGLLIEAINSKARAAFNSPIIWTPINYDAFWSSSSAPKDIWLVQEVIPSQTISIAYPEGTTTSYANFVKCKVKKLNFKSPIAFYTYDFYSAFQQRSEISDARDLVLGLDDELNRSQRNTIRRILNEYENRDDYLLNVQSFNLGGLRENDLFIKDAKVMGQVKESDFDISIAVSKISNLPSISFDDVSKQEIIKAINGS